MPKAVIIRLECYLTYLNQLEKAGKATATSEELARLFGISSSRVRQDMVALGTTGKPRTGYEIVELKQMIIEALDINFQKGIALIGYGNLGRALAGSGIWSEGGFELRAIFDNDPLLIGTETPNGLIVRNTAELFGSIKSENIKAACITVTSHAAQKVADLLAAAGITGIWNFAPIDLNVSPDIFVENQRLEQGLMTLSYRMKEGL